MKKKHWKQQAKMARQLVDHLSAELRDFRTRYPEIDSFEDGFHPELLSEVVMEPTDWCMGIKAAPCDLCAMGPCRSASYRRTMGWPHPTKCSVLGCPKVGITTISREGFEDPLCDDHAKAVVPE